MVTAFSSICGILPCCLVLFPVLLPTHHELSSLLCHTLLPQGFCFGACWLWVESPETRAKVNLSSFLHIRQCGSVMGKLPDLGERTSSMCSACFPTLPTHNEWTLMRAPAYLPFPWALQILYHQVPIGFKTPTCVCLEWLSGVTFSPSNHKVLFLAFLPFRDIWVREGEMEASFCGGGCAGLSGELSMVFLCYCLCTLLLVQQCVVGRRKPFS